MPNIFDDPEAKAAMAAAGVVHKPGVVQEVMHDLAPFLAEEGIDLSEPIDADLDTVNAAFGRAIARYNASLPGVTPAEQPHSRRPSQSTRSPCRTSPCCPPSQRRWSSPS